MKKSYNPFKMWGSWIGAIIIGLIGYESTNLIDLYINKTLNTFSYILYIRSLTLIYLWLFILIGLIVGFLIGWGINSLIRKFK